MKPLIFLDFDGVLFDSVPEVYRVCLEVARNFSDDYAPVSFDEFTQFRSYLTDAWQFNRLFSRSLKITDFKSLEGIDAIEADWVFTHRFFEARKLLMKDEAWADSMKPYKFFSEIKPLLVSNSNDFLIISTRNEDSICRTMAYNGVDGLRVFGQNAVRKHGSKLQVLEDAGFLKRENYMVYIDDMSAHLVPFYDKINLCIQAEWGYDKNAKGAYSEQQVACIIKSFYS